MTYTPHVPILFVLLVLLGCSREHETESSSNDLVLQEIAIPENRLDISFLSYESKKSTWTKDGEAFSGYVYEHFPNGKLKQEFMLHQGKKQGHAAQYFGDGHLSISAHYHQGKLHGEKIVWSADTAHVKLSSLHYHLGKGEGEQKKWYPSGELFMILNLKNGREEGIQQAFRKNGDIYANYEARAGRIFGLKKAALCFGIENEEVRYE